ncbi:MAG: protein-disulfide reductase DsbD domain-containing protein [Myxococcota bacterium]
MSNPVTATLVASTLTAGQPGWIAVRYDIQPGWHIYWKNPGETGIPTTVQLTTPPRWDVGAAQYPGPERFMMPGDLVNYGYDTHAAVLFPVTPQDVAAGTITASTRWLVCRDEKCVPGKATINLDLSSAPEADLSVFLDHLPTPLPAQIVPTRRGQDISVRIKEADQIEVFPNLSAEAALQSVAVDGQTVRLTLKAAPAEDARAILRVTHGGAVRYHQLSLSP